MKIVSTHVFKTIKRNGPSSYVAYIKVHLTEGGDCFEEKENNIIVPFDGAMFDELILKN